MRAARRMRCSPPSAPVYCDPPPPPVYPAVSVANVLRESGVPNARIAAYGRGEDQPIASNLTPEGRSANRRVEIRLVPVTAG